MKRGRKKRDDFEMEEAFDFGLPFSRPESNSG